MGIVCCLAEIHMKCQDLFFLKKKKKKELFPGALRVNMDVSI